MYADQAVQYRFSAGLASAIPVLGFVLFSLSAVPGGRTAARAGNAPAPTFDGVCGAGACRLDEACVESQCLPWTEAPLTADFVVEQHPSSPLEITVRVLAGGFPRHFVEHVRFDFGDDYSGWGEVVTHRFEGPGVYPVELEVWLEGSRLLTASRLVEVGEPRGQTPLLLTVDDIPSYLNGKLPYRTDGGTPHDPQDDLMRPFHLLVPATGFTVDLALHERAADPVRRDSLVVSADRPLGAGTIPAGKNLVSALSFAQPPHQRVPRGRLVVDAAHVFPEGLVKLTATGRTQSGESFRDELTVEVTPLTPDRDPFDRPQEWLLTFAQDLFTTRGARTAGGSLEIDSERGADGVADFAAELALVGAQSHDPAPGAATVVGRGKRGASSVFRAWLEAAVVEEVYRFFHMLPDGTPQDGIAFRVYVDEQLGAPSLSAFRPLGGLSTLRLGGTLADGFLGRSYFGVYNERRIDNTSHRVGVATGPILSALASPPLGEALAAIAPESGAPVGTHALDAAVLADGFDRYDPRNPGELNARYDDLRGVVRFLSRAIAHIAAHEMGHAMGLVPNGAPPEGFFGGRRDVAFMGTRTDSHHADFPPLNLMQAGGRLPGAMLSALERVRLPEGARPVDLVRGFAYEYRLSPYERAYLQRRLTYRNFDGSTAPGYGEPIVGCK